MFKLLSKISKTKLIIWASAFLTIISAIPITMLIIDNSKEISALPSNNKEDLQYDENYLKLSIPNPIVEQNQDIIIEALFQNIDNQKIVWSTNKNDEIKLSNITYQIYGKNNEFIKITNNLNSFFTKNIEICATFSDYIASSVLKFIGKTQDEYLINNLPKSLNNDMLTIFEANEIIEAKFSSFLDTKNDEITKNSLNNIINSESLTDEEKNYKIKELAYKKHIDLIDPIEFNNRKNELIKNSFDDILNNETLNNEQKNIYIQKYSANIDNFFFGINDILTNNDFLLYVDQYLLNDIDLNKIDNREKEQMLKSKINTILNIFSHNNKIILKNHHTFYEDIFNTNLLLDQYSYGNTKFLSNYFIFSDYFDNITYQLDTIIEEQYQISTKISNIQIYNENVNFNIEYQYYDIISNKTIDIVNTNEINNNFIFNFNLDIKNKSQIFQPSLIDFYNNHSFTLNSQYGWDNINNKYWNKLINRNYNNSSIQFDTNLSSTGYTIWSKRGGWWGWENWDIRNYHTFAKNIAATINFNEINSIALSKITTKNISIEELINDNIINSFDWSVNLYGKGTIYYDDFIGETGYEFSYNKTLTKKNNYWQAKAIGSAPDYDGAGQHCVNWKVSVDENKIYLKNICDQLYLYYDSNAIYIENYFDRGQYQNSAPNNFYEGNLKSVNNYSSIKINPLEIDLTNENICDLLLIDGIPYKQDSYHNFKINLILIDISFANNDINYVINNILCGEIQFEIKIYDLSNNKTIKSGKQYGYLYKNITDDMIFKQYEYLADSAKILCINTEKWTATETVIFIQLTSTLAIQTALIILQAITIIKLSTALSFTIWGLALAVYIAIELVILIKSIIDINNLVTDRFFMLDCIKEYIVFILSFPLRFIPIYTLKDKIENNIIISNNNDKYVDNINTINQFNFTSIYDCFIKDSEKINRKYHLSLNSISANISDILIEILLYIVGKKIPLILKNVNDEIFWISIFLEFVQLVIDITLFTILNIINTKNVYTSWYLNSFNNFIN